jgi:hypothetical protein
MREQADVLSASLFYLFFRRFRLCGNPGNTSAWRMVDQVRQVKQLQYTGNCSKVNASSSLANLLSDSAEDHHSSWIRYIGADQ